MSFERFTEFNDKTKTYRSYYKYNGEPCNHESIDIQAAKRIVGLRLISIDLGYVQDWISMIKDQQINSVINSDETANNFHDKKLIRSLFVSAVTTYAKCFTTADGRGTKLERNDIPEYLIDTHDEWMNLRNKYTAHSGCLSYESGSVDIAYKVTDLAVHNSIFINTEQIDTQNLNNISNSIENLVSKVIEIVEEKQKKAETKIINRFKKKITEKHEIRIEIKSTNKYTGTKNIATELIRSAFNPPTSWPAGCPYS